MTPSSAALAAACLTAGLVTAFADTPAHGLVPAQTPPTTSAGYGLYDGSFLTPGSTNGVTTPIIASPQTPPPGTDPVGVLLFTQTASATTLINQNFDSAFLSGTTYTEADVIGYMESPGTANSVQTQAYLNFTEDLGYRYGTSYDATAGPIQAYLFSNGQNAGTFQLADFGTNPSSYSSGIGLASETPRVPPVTPAAVPEPGSLSLLLIGGVALAGVTARRRLRTL